MDRNIAIQEITKQTPKFGAGASKVFTSPHNIIAAIAGQRGGKTTVGAYWALNQSFKLRTESTTTGDKIVAPSGIISAPTYDLLRHSTLKRFFEEFPSLQHYYKEHKREISIPIGKIDGKVVYSTIFTRSLEEFINLRGLKAWWHWMDEGDIAPEGSYEMAKSRMLDHVGWKLLITSTLDTNSWINRLIYQPLMAGRISNAEIISWPSIERPGFPQDEWDRMKKEMDPIQFARDYEGKFSFEAGLVYGKVLEYGIIEKVPSGVKMVAVFYGIDYGLTSPMAIMVIGYGSDGAWYILNEDVYPKIDIEQINDLLRTNLSIFNGSYGSPLATFYDPAGGVATLSLLQDVFPIAAKKDINRTTMLVRNFIYQKRLFILDHCLKTIKEASLYTYIPGSSMPVDENNHCWDAIGYVINNGWLMVDGLEIETPLKPKSRIEIDLENQGLLIDGVFQNIFELEESKIL